MNYQKFPPRSPVVKIPKAGTEYAHRWHILSPPRTQLQRKGFIAVCTMVFRERYHSIAQKY